jgi:hypothetical protein
VHAAESDPGATAAKFDAGPASLAAPRQRQQVSGTGVRSGGGEAVEGGFHHHAARTLMG